MDVGPERAYVTEIPPAWRALAVITYLSGFFGAGGALPFAVWAVFHRSRFLTSHALCAGLLHLAGILIAAVLSVPSYLFLLEFEQFFITPDEFAGQLFAADQTGAVVFLMIATGFFMAAIVLPALSAAEIRPRAGRPSRDGLLGYAFLATIVTPVFFYMNGIWGPTGRDDAFFSLDLRQFRDAYVVFPGHPILLACVWMSIVAGRGERVLPPGVRALFIRFQQDRRSTGTAHEAAAVLRARLLPGWGQFFAGRRIAGLAVLGLFFLLALFFWISAGLNYGRIMEGTPGANVNFAWNFLSRLGMRTHMVTDAELDSMLGNPVAFVALLVALALVYWYGIRATRAVYRESKTFFLTIAHSILLHIIPVAVLLIMPAVFLPASGRFFVPDFEKSEDLDLDGAEVSGDEGEDELLGGDISPVPVEFLPPSMQNDQTGDLAQKEQSEQEVAEARRDESKKPSDRMSLREEGEESGKPPGERRRQTYSNYLSVKIRAPEKEMDFWDRIPENYSAVFEYHISAEGRVHDVSVVEASDHPEADRLTVRLIQSMGIVLPPPGKRAVVITELFWNTGRQLPTELQQELSKIFDGRRIEYTE